MPILIIKKNIALRRLVFVCFLFSAIQNTHAFEASPTAKFSLLTCTPGPDLYSLFGHSAIRYQDSIRGQWVDWVYNYGTFVFDDDFYLKFAQGKLDYVLAKEDFPFFQEEYIFTGRGIFEQELLLTNEENQSLLDLLEENFLPQNRTYRYDFFYDNCSTRIRDIIIRATSGNNTSVMGFVHPDTHAIAAMSRINFSHVYPGSFTFREAIQTYLDFQPWSDFGIDLALGIPCDKEIEKGQFMFLPDSLMIDFSHAIYSDRPLVAGEDELLPQEYMLSIDSICTPIVVMTLFLFFHLAVGLLLRHRSLFTFSDRILLLVTGLLGTLVVFLWFFTDHTATKWNLNILWANPLNLIFAIFYGKKWSNWRMIWMRVYFFILISTLVFWFVLPQRLNFAAIPIIFALLFTIVKVVRPRVFMKQKSTELQS